MTSNDADKTSELESNTHALNPGEQTVLVDIPKVLGSYRLTRLLGRGGMGEVWQAFDKNLERDVAVKLMRKELLQNDDAVRRFAREARAVARLNHPNIVHVYAFGDEKGLMYFVMELVEGSTVSQRLKQEGCVELSEAVGIIMQAIDGLSYACERGIIHRDIKLSNLMVTPDGRVKIADFGLAKMVEHDTQMTAAGTAMGSPNYMSPEQARGEEADHRSDIYALGVSLYQMLCGGLPFTGDSPLSVLLKQIQEPLPEPEHLKQLRKGAALDVIKRMTAKAPDARYQNYEELATALAAVVPERRYVGVHSITASYPAASEATVGTETGVAPLAATAFDRKSEEKPIRAEESFVPLDRTLSSSSVPVEEPKAAPRNAVGLLVVGLGLLAAVLVAAGIWWLGGRGDGAVEDGSRATVAANDATAPPSAQPGTTPAPAPTPAGGTNAGTSGSSGSTVAGAPSPVVSPAPFQTPGMQSVNITATVPVRVTPMPGVQTVLTPRTTLAELLPEGVEPLRTGAGASVAGAQAAIFVLGTAGAGPDEQVPVYRDSQGRVFLRNLPAGTEVQVLRDGAAMLQVRGPDGQAVYVYKRMAKRK